MSAERHLPTTDRYETLFRLGLFLLPFDNLFFAPSSGWASISPFLFGLYYALHFVKRPAVSRTTLSLVLFWIFSIVYGLLWSAFKVARFPDIIDGATTLFLGFVFYLALTLRYQQFRVSLEADIAVVIKGYVVSFIYGVFQFIAMNFVPVLHTLFLIIQKRTAHKLQFSFTEPSFISLHVIGLLFLLKQMTNAEGQKDQIHRLMVAFSLFSVAAFASTRFLVDLVVFFAIGLVMRVFTPSIGRALRLKRAAVLLAVCILIGLSATVLFSESFIGARGMRIVEGGIYADGSLASRFFRINASLKAYEVDQVQLWLGNGFGGSLNAMLAGFEPAFREYRSNYTVEVFGILNGGDTRVFSLPIRIVNEFGVVFLVLVVGTLLVKALEHPFKLRALLVVIWLLVQFDSYAHPLVWLLVFYLFHCSVYRDGWIQVKSDQGTSQESQSPVPRRSISGILAKEKPAI